MGIFGKLFGSKKLKVIDSDYGEIESFSVRRDNVGWAFKKRYMDSDIEILISGNKEKLSENQKLTLTSALNNEMEIKSESEEALKMQFDNAEMKFISIEKHFDLSSMSVNDSGFELTFQEKNDPYYYFNVHFENNKQVGVSIDG